MKKSLAIVILTWNDFNNTSKCIMSILPQLNEKYKIILIDNGSNNFYFNKNLNFLKKKFKNKFLHIKKKKL